MFAVISICVCFLLFVIISYKIFGFSLADRGVDEQKKETISGIVVGKEPYVTPKIDQQITEQMESLQQLLIPVQYVDFGLMPKIEKNIQAVKAHIGHQSTNSDNNPNPYTEKNDHAEAKFKTTWKIDTQIRNTSLNKYSDYNKIEPYNSFLGMVVSKDQNVNLVD